MAKDAHLDRRCKREAERLALEALTQNGDAIRPYQVEAVTKAIVAFGAQIIEQASQVAYRIAERAAKQSSNYSRGKFQSAIEIADAIRALIRER